MPLLRALSLLLTLAFLSAHAQQPTLTAAEIMARVAANQDRSEAERAHYVYIQHARVTSGKSHTIRCEEITDTRVTPTPTGSQQQLLTLQGRLLHKGSYITYNHLADSKDAKQTPQADDNSKATLVQIDNDDDTDVGIVENMRDSLLGNKSEHNKDGIDSNLFPLTSKEQTDYTFTLLGHEPRNGHDTFHIQFRPKDKSDIGWKGDAWIDTATFQPVVIRTALSRNLPLGVRVLLGTNVPGIGFTVIYAPQPANQPNGVWFPVSLGSEFKVHVLFFFSRQIVISAENRDFEKTHVTSTILNADNPTLVKPQP